MTLDQVLATLPNVRDIVLTVVPLYAGWLGHKRLRLADEQRREDHIRAERERGDYWHKRLYAVLDRVNADETAEGLAGLNRLVAIEELADIAIQAPEHYGHITGVLEKLEAVMTKRYEGKCMEALYERMENDNDEVSAAEWDEAARKDIGADGGKDVAKYLGDAARKALDRLEATEEKEGSEQEG